MNEAQFKAQLEQYVELMGGRDVANGKIVINPVVNEDKSGFKIDGHYHYQNVWAFEKIFAAKPKEHIDFGSQVSWVEILAVTTKVTYYDLGMPWIKNARAEYKIGNVTQTYLPSNSVESLSSLHVIEHVGLGRYGDPLEPRGTELACRELARILAPGGRLYLSLPVGVEMTHFNAHRILNPERILEWCKGLKLLELSASHVYDRPSNPGETNFIKNIDIKELGKARYSCGMYEFTKE